MKLQTCWEDDDLKKKKNSAYSFKLIPLGVILVVAGHLFFLALCPQVLHDYLFHRKRKNGLLLSFGKKQQNQKCVIEYGGGEACLIITLCGIQHSFNQRWLNLCHLLSHTMTLARFSNVTSVHKKPTFLNHLIKASLILWYKQIFFFTEFFRIVIQMMNQILNHCQN